jgi:ATP-dependent protease HslVU (ClpYQ) peptidase subunit
LKNHLFAYILLILVTFNQSANATTIAWDGRYLACDTQMTAGHRKTKCATKIWYSPDRKAYLGCAGTVSDIMKVRKWFLDPKHANEETADIKGDMDVLIVYETGRVLLWTEDMSKEPVEIDDQCALGSGGDFALAAMLCGKDAGEAVIVASQLDIGTNSRIRKYEVIKPNHFEAPEMPHIEDQQND